MKVLALIDGDNAVCCRYRIEAFERAMAEQGMGLEIVAVRQRHHCGGSATLRKAKQADVVILQRKLIPLWQTSLLRRWARRLIFDFDDAVFQRDSNSGKGPESRSRSAKFRAIVIQGRRGYCGQRLSQAGGLGSGPRRGGCILSRLASTPKNIGPPFINESAPRQGLFLSASKPRSDCSIRPRSNWRQSPKVFRAWNSGRYATVRPIRPGFA